MQVALNALFAVAWVILIAGITVAVITMIH